MKLFNKVLIANRGEIAVRIIQTCKKLGIQTVAVYSNADEKLLPVQLADEAVCIGSFRANESYLYMEAILQAALQTECQAVHPGYGFLAENARFSALCHQHGLTFIGPTPQQITKMGNKTEAKMAAEQGGLNLIPGSDGVLESAEEGQNVADRIGYPVLLKAKAGGGGRGMRIVSDQASFKSAFEEASMEAHSAFGDGSLYLEKLILNARHIEVQVALDHYGNGVHFGIRDCSIQRKHQKLLEEAPSAVLSEERIDQLGTQVIEALQKIKYFNVGTVEFLMSPEKEFFFIEMNTRLQVEHPISEKFVESIWFNSKLKLPANRPLSLKQSDIQRQGHSIECRINAENPDDNFKPSPGKILEFTLPEGDGVRVDTFLNTGAEIPPYYDSLIAKLIVHGATREEAIAKMKEALSHFQIKGIDTTISFHQKIMENPSFIQGEYHTGFLETIS